MRLLEALQWLAVTLWVGGLWAIGFIVAPSLFHALEDRALAGSLAARFFALIAWVGFACAGYLLTYRWLRFGAAALTQAFFWIVLIMAALGLAGHLGVQPVLESLKAQVPHQAVEALTRQRFVVWHGVASLLYLLQSALGGALVLLPRAPR